LARTGSEDSEEVRFGRSRSLAEAAAAVQSRARQIDVNEANGMRRLFMTRRPPDETQKKHLNRAEDETF
jgi:hypothetical protein